jgi:GT2 family glycosyltransferase
VPDAPTFAICVGTYGDQYWSDLAHARALTSTLWQDADEVLVRHDPDGERHRVRNQLGYEAKSDWLVFLDADDHLAPGFITALRAAAPERGRALLNPAVGHAHRPDEHSVFAPKDLRLGNYMIIGTAVQREVFTEVGGFWDWGGFEDWELWIRCTKAGATVIQVPDAVYLIDSTERSRDANACVADTSRWLAEIRHYHWPERYSRPRSKRIARH